MPLQLCNVHAHFANHIPISTAKETKSKKSSIGITIQTNLWEDYLWKAWLTITNLSKLYSWQERVILVFNQKWIEKPWHKKKFYIGLNRKETCNTGNSNFFFAFRRSSIASVYGNCTKSFSATSCSSNKSHPHISTSNIASNGFKLNRRG